MLSICISCTAASRCSRVSSQEVVSNLLAIRNNYPKYVVSLDEWISGSITDGIQHLHLATFLQMDL